MPRKYVTRKLKKKTLVKARRFWVRFSKSRDFFKKSLALVVILALLVFNKPVTKADVAYFYSPLCLGGWQYPQHIEGEPQVPLGSDVTNYTNDNSAVLDNTSGEVYCGKFAGQGLPSDVSVNHLTLMISMGVSETSLAPIPFSDFENGKTLDALPSSSGSFIISVPIGSQGSSSFEISPIASPSDTPAPEPVPSKISTPRATPTPSPMEEPSIIPSPSPDNQGAFNFVPTAHADTIESPAFDDILQVRYTIDGENWVVLGNISKSNSQHASFNIPINSTNDIQNIQVGVSSLATIDSQAVIYIDSMWLEAEYDSSALTFIKDVGQQVFDALTLQPLLDPAPTDSPSIIASTSLEVTPKPKIKKTVYAFTLNQPSQYVTENSGALTISAPCTDTYFVVVAYRNKDDHSDDPTSSVYNKATACQNGNFSAQLSDFPDVDTGDYYMILGHESDKGPWTPISDPIKFHLDVKVVEVDK